MSLNSIFLILWKQFSSKWGRFLLASGGIMIGIWAICLTTSLSIGLSDSLISSVNSQPAAKTINITKEDPNPNDQNKVISNSPSLTLQDLKSIQDKNPDILEINPTISAEFKTPFKFKNLESNQEVISDLTLNNTSNNWLEFYDTYRTNIIGSKEKPKAGEVIMCFRCAYYRLNDSLKYEKPEDMLNKTIELKSDILKTNNFKIVGVIDDRADKYEYSQVNFYIDRATNYKESNQPFGFAEAYVNDFDNLPSTIESIKKQGFGAYSITIDIVKGIQTVFTVLTAVLSSFGLIALIASVFGIINVMTISVLERKKEIGILKSLGAKNRDIFLIFLFESSIIGFVGWLFGYVLALLSGLLITTIFKIFLTNNPDWSRNLDQINIQTLSPSFPYWLLLGTLAIAVFFTTISGLFPSLKAARQNPVDVLRSE
jgi:ABC-type antimicrobial peptide transport system permease subunit